jgi:hypothetical protein
MDLGQCSDLYGIGRLDRDTARYWVDYHRSLDHHHCLHADLHGAQRQDYAVH